MKQFNENINISIQNLTSKPGVYKFIDKTGKIIYIGKAKNLKKRVSSYFTKEHEDTKTRFLVNKIESIEFTSVNNESDALLLENNLIKEYKPRYNILLRDDKTYPWICITNEMFPKLFKTRNRINNGSHYFGPYSSGLFLKNLLELIKQLFPLRNCHYTFSEENILKNKYKVCLEYHIGNCKAPCVGIQNEENYDENIAQIIKILKGDYHSIKNSLINKMHDFSKSLQFEDAQNIKSKLQIFDNFQSKSVVVSSSLTNIDVFSVINEKEISYVNYLMIVNGSVIQAHNMSLKKNVEESDSDVLLLAIQNSRELFGSVSKEIIVPFKPEFTLPDVKLEIPQRGDKKRLLELSEKNAKLYRHDVIMHQMKADYGKVNVRLLESVQSSLRLPSLPVHMECFDNSNIQGEFPVASCVVFLNGKPSKKEYRHFNIKTVTGPDDFASMAEVIERRYKRLLEENKHLPQLIIVDGGKGQLSAAYEILTKLGLTDRISLISIAKRLEEIFIPNDPLPLYLDKRSEVLKLIQRMRDEAHRFGITFHRNKRSKDFLQSELINIPGIGDKTIEQLLTHFKSIENIKAAPQAELETIIGKIKAQVLIKYFQ